MYCELCDMENCADHGAGRERAIRQAAHSRVKAEIQVSPRNIAHFAGCLHKGNDKDFTGWGFIRDVNDAWARLGNGEQIATNARVDRLVSSRCMTCESTGP